MTWAWTVLISAVASAGTCRQFLDAAADNLRRTFNQRVIEAHMARTQRSFVLGFEATRHDRDISGRIDRAVRILDHARPGWDVDQSLQMLATADPIPLIERGVVPRIYPAHTVVLIESRRLIPVLAIRIDGEQPEVLTERH